MKIILAWLHIHPDVLEGGGTFLSELATEFSKKKIETIFLAPFVRGKEEYKIVNYMKGKSILRYFVAAKKYKDAIKKHSKQGDIIHCLLPAPSFSRISDKISKFNKNVYVTFGNPLWDKTDKTSFSKQQLVHRILKSRILARLSKFKANKYIVSTKHQKDELIGMVSANKIEVIPNGISLENFKPYNKKKARKEFGICDGKIISYIGHFSTTKGISDLVEAFEILKKQGENIKLTIAWSGKGDINKQILNKINMYRKTKDIMLFYTVDVRKFLAASDMLVIPYRATYGTYNYPSTILEAFGMKKPVISTSTGCINELISNNVNGILVQRSNPTRLAEAIVNLFGDKKLYNKIRKNAYDKIRKEHDIKIIAKKYLKIFGIEK